MPVLNVGGPSLVVHGVRSMAVVSVLATMTGCCGVSSSGACLRSRTIRSAAAAGDTDKLRQWLKDDRSWVREEAAATAGRFKRASLTSRVQEHLLDSNERPWVRAAAASALGQFQTGVDARDARERRPRARHAPRSQDCFGRRDLPGGSPRRTGSGGWAHR